MAHTDDADRHALEAAQGECKRVYWRLLNKEFAP